MKIEEEKLQSTHEEFHSVDFFRKVKTDIAKKLSGKTFNEQKRVLQQLQNNTSLPNKL